MNSKNVHITLEDGSSSQIDSIHKASNLKIQVKYSYQKNKEQKPRRNKSAFIIFSGDARAKIKEAVGELNSNEMMVKLAERWKNLSPEEREKYDLLAKNDKLRYQQELVDYAKCHPNETIHNKTKHNHVKKPCSAYGIFLKERKSSIKEDQPKLKMADVLKIVSEEWKNISDAEKKKYQDIAFLEKEAKTNELKEAFLKDQNTKDNVSVAKDKNKKEKTKKGKNTTKKVKKETDVEVQQDINIPKYEEDSVKVEPTHTPTLQTFSSHTISSSNPSEIWPKLGEINLQSLTKLEDMNNNSQIKAEAAHLPDDIPGLLNLYRHSSSLELMMNAGLLRKQSDNFKDSFILSQFTRPTHKSNDILNDILKMDNIFDMDSIFDSTSFIAKMKSDSTHSISKFFDFSGKNKNGQSKIETPNDVLKSLLENDRNGPTSRGKVLNETITSLLGNTKSSLEELPFDKLNSDIFKSSS